MPDDDILQELAEQLGALLAEGETFEDEYDDGVYPWRVKMTVWEKRLHLEGVRMLTGIYQELAVLRKKLE